MKFDPGKIVRENIRKLIPYSSARDEYTGKAAIYLDANENPFNSPYNRYPDPQQRLLKQKVSDLFSVQSDNLFLGNGSDEAIDLLFRVFCEPGKDNVISMAPSYGMYEVCASINDIEMRKVLLERDFSLNTKKILDRADENTKMIFLCSPNNPTGNLINSEEVLDILNAFNGLLVIDEAYIDFSNSEGMLPFLPDYPNLVILRTFSKAWGLAGIRLGMAFASSPIIQLLTKVKYPYNLNLLTQEYALKAIKNRKQKEKWVDEIVRERQVMTEKLRKMEIVDDVYPSDANFLLVKFRDPVELYIHLKDQGIIVRDRSRVSLCEGSLRITVGTKFENKILLREIKSYSHGLK